MKFTKQTKLKNVAKPKPKIVCGTCFGYGLWAMGDSSPMGPMDAADGLPTRPCPECGANRNNTHGTKRKTKT